MLSPCFCNNIVGFVLLRVRVCLCVYGAQENNPAIHKLIRPLSPPFTSIILHPSSTLGFRWVGRNPFYFINLISSPQSNVGKGRSCCLLVVLPVCVCVCVYEAIPRNRNPGTRKPFFAAGQPAHTHTHARARTERSLERSVPKHKYIPKTNKNR